MHRCDYKTVKEDQFGIRQVCKECKKPLIIKKDPKTGRINNKKYLAEHVRDTAQPFGKTAKIFGKYYGEEAKYIKRFKNG